MTSTKESDAIISMVKEEFKIVGGDFEKETKKEQWYSKRKFTKKQKELWRKFCVNMMIKKLHYSKKTAEQEFRYIDLNYGFSEECTSNDKQ